MTKLIAAVQVKGVKPLVSKLSTIEEMKPVRELLQDAAKIAEDTARDKAPRFSGALAQGFVAEIHPFSATVRTIKEKYPVVMEAGRRPGAKMPPPRALEAWARTKGIENVFVLAQAIARRGIKGRFFRRKARGAVRKEMPRLVDEMKRKIETIWGRPIAEAD